MSQPFVTFRLVLSCDYITYEGNRAVFTSGIELLVLWGEAAVTRYSILRVGSMLAEADL